MESLTASYPWYTPYQFAGNKPIAAIDLDGLEEELAFQLTDDYFEPEIRTTAGELLQVGIAQSAKGLTSYSNNQAVSFALRNLKDGKLYATNGKVYQTSRSASYDLYDFHGKKYANVPRGVNFGWSYRGQSHTTKGLNQLELFTNKSIWKQAGKIFAQAGSIYDVVQFLSSVADRNIDPFVWNPFGYIAEIEINESNMIFDYAFQEELHSAINRGLYAVEDFLNSNFTASKRYSVQYISDAIFEKLIHGDSNTIMSCTTQYTKMKESLKMLF